MKLLIENENSLFHTYLAQAYAPIANPLGRRYLYLTTKKLFMPKTATMDFAENMSTEDKIHQAALEVFTRKGYAATKTRDIAEAVGINVATLHYYHRTKDQLFGIVAKESMAEFSAAFHEVFTQERPLKEKIHLFVERFTELFREKPHLASFCLMESERKIEFFKEIIDFKESTRVLRPQLESLAAKGKIRPISPANFISALVGMTIYPFITRTSMYYAHELDDAGFHEVLEEQKRMVPAMIIGYLYGN
ncbi:MAG: TetR/AcrR family transcriptional regulator [Bacteroidota bacterium]